MNSYLLSVFLILCFGPWTTAREVHQRLSRNSAAEVLEERKSPLMNGFVRVTSQAQTWIQCLRKLLKALKKWWNSHPYEVKLGKCFASYLKGKISGAKQHGKIPSHAEDLQGAESPWTIPRITRRAAAALFPGQRSIFEGNFPENGFIPLHFRDFLLEMNSRYVHYRDSFLNDKLIVCVSEYFWKKFWTWVDLTPDSTECTSS